MLAVVAWTPAPPLLLLNIMPKQLSAVLATEQPTLRVLVVDPGDMRTEMHQDAFPGEDISDRPLPAAVVPGLVALINSDHPGGRVRVSEVVS